MKQNYFLLLIAVVAVNISGCKKIIDYLGDDPGGVAGNCRIERITNADSLVVVSDPSLPKQFFENTTFFNYDARGNLTHIHALLNDVGEEYRYDPFGFDSYFKYDSENRLVLYLEAVDTSWADPNLLTVLRWHKYTYVDSHTIIDTIGTYVSSHLNDNNVPDSGFSPETTSVERIKLDFWGRIIQVDYISSSSPSSDFYSYNAAGNLDGAGTYTNKLSILQTSKTLMFIRRNYSVNTLAGHATTFNSNKLPLDFTSPRYIPLIASLNFGLSDGETLEMDYDIRVFYRCDK